MWVETFIKMILFLRHMPLPTQVKSSGTVLKPAEAIHTGIEAWERIVEWTARVGGRDLTPLPYWMARPFVSYFLARAQGSSIVGIQANGSLNAAFGDSAQKPVGGELSELDFYAAAEGSDFRLLLTHGVETYPELGRDTYRYVSLMARHPSPALPSVTYRCAQRPFPVSPAGMTSQLVASITTAPDEQPPYVPLSGPVADTLCYRVLDFGQTRVIAPLKPLRIDTFHETLDNLIAVTNETLRQLGVRDNTFPDQALRLPTVTNI